MKNFKHEQNKLDYQIAILKLRKEVISREENLEAIKRNSFFSVELAEEELKEAVEALNELGKEYNEMK